MRRLLPLLSVLILIAIILNAPVSAQSNLLVNPGLEEGSLGPYTTRRGGEFPIYLPNGWNFWLASSTAEFFNRGERTTISPHPGPGPNPQEGARAVNVNCGYVTCTAAIFQQVSVQANTPITASAYAQVKVCNLPPNGTTCGSAVESGAQTRVGIDPNGGTDPNESDIVWSAFAQPHDRWDQMSVTTTTTGTTATIFLYSTQTSPGDLNRTYWDQTSLTGAGGSGAIGTPGATAVPPTPTPIPEVPFVSAQSARPDGSIIHVVNAGDTLDSIAVAYSLTRSDILALNGLESNSILRIGQEIIIREAQPATATPEPEITAEPETVAQVPTETGSESPAPVATQEEDTTWKLIIPPLTAPEGATEDEEVRSDSQGSKVEGQRTIFSHRRIVSDITADVIINDYNTQLATAGWTLITGATGANFAWSSWTFSTSDGLTWGGTIYISASPTLPGNYNVTLLIEEGFFTG